MYKFYHIIIDSKVYTSCGFFTFLDFYPGTRKYTAHFIGSNFDNDLKIIFHFMNVNWFIISTKCSEARSFETNIYKIISNQT